MAQVTERNYHPFLKAERLPDLEDNAKTAFRGAQYHLEKVLELLKSPGMTTLWKWNTDLDKTTEANLQTQVNMFHFHLRAFFWELVATYDTILTWANHRYNLGVKEHNIRWEKSIDSAKAKVDEDEWKQKRSLLEETWNSEWYFQVRAYRNFAHRGFIYGTSEYKFGVNILNATLSEFRLQLAQDGQQRKSLEAHLLRYVAEMKQLLLAIYPPSLTNPGNSQSA